GAGLAPTGRVRAGAAPEERPLAELRAAGVSLAVLGDVRRARADRVQARDDAVVAALHLAVDGDGQTAHREAGVHCTPERQIEYRPGSISLRRNVFRLLVEVGVFPVGSDLVVASPRARAPPRR